MTYLFIYKDQPPRYKYHLTEMDRLNGPTGVTAIIRVEDALPEQIDENGKWIPVTHLMTKE